jgi:DNA-directed RNA polymerase specialized sigma24 family protein
MFQPPQDINDPNFRPSWPDESWLTLYRWVVTVLNFYRTLQAADRDDLAQEVLHQILRRPLPESPATMHKLATMIAHRAADNWFRRFYRPEIRCRKPLVNEIAEMCRAPAAVDFDREIDKASRLMTSDTRDVFAAVFLQGMTLADTAEKLGRSLHEVRRRRFQAERVLRRIWEPEGSAEIRALKHGSRKCFSCRARRTHNSPEETK